MLQETARNAARREKLMRGQWAVRAGRWVKKILFIGKWPMNWPQISKLYTHDPLNGPLLAVTF